MNILDFRIRWVAGNRLTINLLSQTSVTDHFEPGLGEDVLPVGLASG